MQAGNSKTGYMAFVKGDNTKALNNHWSGGYQTGTNKQTLTTDLLYKATITVNKTEIEMMCNWFNSTHKKKIEFDIREVELQEIRILTFK